MIYTSFDNTISRLSSFDTIGYDKEKQLLKVIFFNGTSIIYKHVLEFDIFSFIISQDKESFYQQHICNQYEQAETIVN